MFILAIDLANLYTYQSLLVYFHYYVLESNQAVIEIIKLLHSFPVRSHLCDL